jgi:hypothetical protein
MKKKNVNKRESGRENVKEKGRKKDGKNHGGVHALHPVTIRTRQVRAIELNFQDWSSNRNMFAAVVIEQV